MKPVFLIASLVLLLGACAHTAGPGSTAAGGVDDAGEEDAILRTFDEPREESETEETDRAEAGPPDELDRGEETEDSILSTVDETAEKNAGGLVVDEPDELDTSEVREDPILSVLEKNEHRREEKARKRAEKRARRKARKKGGGGGGFED